jgi:hypothetical protein
MPENGRFVESQYGDGIAPDGSEFAFAIDCMIPAWLSWSPGQLARHE